MKKSTYVSIDKEYLDEGSKPDFDIFSANHEKTYMSIYLQSGAVIDEKIKKDLKNLEKLYIMKEFVPTYDEYVKKHITKINNEAVSNLEMKAITIYEDATKAVDNIFHNPYAKENVKAIYHVVEELVDVIVHDELVIESLLRLIAHDYYTHTHSINVSIYALCLGSFLKMDKTNLKSLGVAALMHDIGKSKVDAAIINKNGILTDAEYNQIKKHPIESYLIVKNLGITDEKILSGIKYHHEKLDGTGYPDGLVKIPLFAKIIAICDVYDALNTKRSYKEGMSIFETLYFMKKNMQHHLDIKLLNEFIKMFKHNKK